jgi:hypothetical protein
MKKIFIIISILLLYNDLYSQNKFIYNSKNYDINILVITKHDSLYLEFEFENKSKKSLLLSKETPCIVLRWSKSTELLELMFGPDMRTMNETTFLTEEIFPGKKCIMKVSTVMPKKNEFNIKFSSNLFWVKNNKVKKENIDYKQKDYDWSEIYFPIKI